MRPRVDPLALPALHASHVGIWIASADGRVQRVGRGEAIAAVAATPQSAATYFAGSRSIFVGSTLRS